MMNLYLVISEQLEDHGDWYEPPEIYCIAELVVARNRSQAKYLAWKQDKNSFYPGYFIDEMPKFRINLKMKGLEGPARIVSNDTKFLEDAMWAALWGLNYGKQ